jgi:hypothetical protein
MACCKSLERNLGQARAGGSANAFTKWVTLAQDGAGWRKPVTERLFGIGKSLVRPPRCDTSVPPEEIWRFFVQRAAEVALRGCHTGALSQAPQHKPTGSILAKQEQL